MTAIALADELCAVFAAERRAIAALDDRAIEELGAHKAELAMRFVEACRRERCPLDVVTRVRTEAQANAILARTAADAVRAVLGYAPSGYDRRAQPVTSHAERVLTAL